MLIRHTVCRFLEERGYAVESATNGVDALERLKEIRPDILITDMMMPKMDGSQLITELKKNLLRHVFRSFCSRVARVRQGVLPSAESLQLFGKTSTL
jgi:CheY-like chemotaxis protein